MHFNCFFKHCGNQLLLLTQFCTFAIVSPDPPDPNHPTSNQLHRISQRQTLDASNQIDQVPKVYSRTSHKKGRQEHWVTKYNIYRKTQIPFKIRSENFELHENVFEFAMCGRNQVIHQLQSFLLRNQEMRTYHLLELEGSGRRWWEV